MTVGNMEGTTLNYSMIPIYGTLHYFLKCLFYTMDKTWVLKSLTTELLIHLRYSLLFSSVYVYKNVDVFLYS